MKSYEILPTGSIAGGAGPRASAKSTGCGCRGSGCGSKGGGCGSAVGGNGAAEPGRQFLGRKLKEWEILPPSRGSLAVPNFERGSRPDFYSDVSDYHTGLSTAIHSPSRGAPRMFPFKTYPAPSPLPWSGWEKPIFQSGRCIVPPTDDDIYALFPVIGPCSQFNSECNSLAVNLRHYKRGLRREEGRAEYWARLRDECMRLNHPSNVVTACSGLELAVESQAIEAGRLNSFLSICRQDPRNSCENIAQELLTANVQWAKLNDMFRECSEAARDSRTARTTDRFWHWECMLREVYADNHFRLAALFGSWVDSYEHDVQERARSLHSHACGICDPVARAEMRQGCRDRLSYPQYMGP